MDIREHLLQKECFLSGIARITSPHPCPQFGQVVQLFLDVQNDILARITEPSNDDTLQLALDSARFEFTLKMRLNRI